MSCCVHALRYADWSAAVVCQGPQDKLAPKPDFVSGVLQLVWSNRAQETLRTMVCAHLLCDLSFVANDTQEQVRPSACARARRQLARDVQPVLQSDKSQAPTWCKRSIRAAQLGIGMFAQFRTLPEAKFLDLLPDGARAMSTHTGSLLF